MNSLKTKYKIAITLFTLVVAALAATSVVFFQKTKDLKESLVWAKERIAADSLLITNHKFVDRELYDLLNSYDSSWVFLSNKEDLLPFLDKMLKSHAREIVSFQSQLAMNDSKINGLKEQIIEFESHLSYAESNKSFYESKIISLQTELVQRQELLDSVNEELEKVEYELSITSVDTTCIYAPNGNKIFYYGKMVDQSPQNFGIGFYEGKGYYIGEWDGNHRNGRGKHTYKDGSVYEGYFKNDLRSGFGTYFYVSGDVYKGNWKDDLMDGEGEITQADGKSIKGTWKAGKYLKTDFVHEKS